ALPELQRRGEQAAHQGGDDRVPQGGRREVRLVRRRARRRVPGREGDAAAGRAAAGEEPLRNAARREGARDAPPRTADARRAHHRPGAAPHASDAGTDGGNAGGDGRADGPGRRRGVAVTRMFATALVAAAAVAGVFAQSDAPAISHEYAEVNGQRLHYAKIGRGPLMIFLHGFPEFWYEWKSQLAEISRDNTAVPPDLPGYNLSSKPPEVADYAVPNIVADVH